MIHSTEELNEQIRQLILAFTGKNPGMRLALDPHTVSMLAAMMDGVVQMYAIEIGLGSTPERVMVTLRDRNAETPSRDERGEIVASWEGPSVLTGLAGIARGPFTGTVPDNSVN